MTRFATALLCIMMLCVPAAASAQEMQNGATGFMPGDVVRLTIFREEELSGLFQVPPDGKVIFGKIGPVQVTGRTASELRDELHRLYSRYLVNYTVRVEQLHKVTVLGEVKTPNVYTLDPTNTLRDALAVAGGVTEAGRTDRVELRRGGEVVEVLLVDRTIADAAVRSGDQIYVPQRSYISRNAPTLAAVLTGAAGLLVALFAK